MAAGQRRHAVFMEKMKIVVPCLFGLESIAAGELKRMRMEDVQTLNGKVTFLGDFSDVARANIGLRTGERVMIELGRFPAASFEELFQGVLSCPLEDYIGKADAFPVKGWSLNSALHSIPDCQSIIKKAAVERLKKYYRVAWFEETGSVHQIRFSILKDEVSIMLDTSGAGLHKRGYRKNANAAPIKETLAAGILDLARVKADTVLYDPLCGSGTFLIEGALRGFGIAPGVSRKFAAEGWAACPPDVFKAMRQEAMEKIDRRSGFVAYGGDIDPESVLLAQENSKKAGVSGRIRVEKKDLTDFEPQSENGVIVCNPPYGERMLDVKQARELYRRMGEVFASKAPGFPCYVISPDEEFEQSFGRKANKKRKLYNGMLKCDLYMYF